jgi:hypothetical protein
VRHFLSKGGCFPVLPALISIRCSPSISAILSWNLISTEELEDESLIRYHYVGIDTNRPHSTKVLDLFYNDIKPNVYCDIIAENYSEKLPLIFEKWNFLQDQLGFLLYDSFDFLIYKNTRSKGFRMDWRKQRILRRYTNPSLKYSLPLIATIRKWKDNIR